MNLFDGYTETVLAKFKEFHLANPAVYDEFRKLAIAIKNTGRAHYSAEIIINTIRWHRDLQTTGEVFKLNNDFKPLYARLLAYQFPEFLEFFEFRKIRSQGVGSIYERDSSQNC